MAVHIHRKITVIVIILVMVSYGAIHAQSVVVVDESAFRRVTVPTAALADGWYSDVRYAATKWTNARTGGGIGYENGTAYAPWIQTDLGSQMYGPDKNTSCYIRIMFSVDHPESYGLVKHLTLRVCYDDGFVAWLNGQKVAEANAPADLSWNSAATQSHEASAQPDSFDVTFALPSFTLGYNLLAIQGLNDSSTSPHFLITASLTAEVENPLSASGSSLPIVQIDSHDHAIQSDIRSMAELNIIDNGPGLTNHLGDAFDKDSGPIRIEIRGSSSAGYPKHSYNFETENADSSNRNVKLLGFPKDNDWIFYAPYIDKSLVRNVLGYWLSNRTGLYASRTRFCEVTLNNVYQGVYVLMEKIKQGKYRVPIADLKPADDAGDSLTGGYILKLDRISGESFTSHYKSAGYNKTQVVYQYQDPAADKLTTAQKNYIRDFIYRFEDVMAGPEWADPDSGYAKWIDVDTFADYFFVNEIAKNVDAWRLSTFMYKDRDSRGGKLCMGPVWDLDLAFGNANYYDGWDTDDWMLETLQHIPEQAMIPFWWPKLFQDPAFRQHLQERWNLLRQNELHSDFIHARIEAWADTLAVPMQRNFSMWAGPGVDGCNGYCFWPVPSIFYTFKTYRDEIDYLESWVQDRLRWMDDHISALPTVVQTTTMEPVRSFRLEQNYPNPFNGITVIPFSLDKHCTVRFTICDIQGRRVWELPSRDFPAGTHEVVWDGTDINGRAVASGIYLCTGLAGKKIQTIKLLLVE